MDLGALRGREPTHLEVDHCLGSDFIRVEQLAYSDDSGIDIGGLSHKGQQLLASVYRSSHRLEDVNAGFALAALLGPVLLVHSLILTHGVAERSYPSPCLQRLPLRVLEFRTPWLGPEGFSA